MIDNAANPITATSYNPYSAVISSKILRTLLFRSIESHVNANPRV